jgi:hypothetical protein
MTEGNESCFGFCSQCKVVHALPSENAKVKCFELMEKLREHKRLDFDQPLEASDSRLSTEFMYSNMRGKMLGILICVDQHGQEVQLQAYSSKYNGIWNIPGWAPPLVNAETYVATIQAGDLEIHPLTEYINTLVSGSAEWKLRVAERKEVSHTILAKLQGLYEVHNFNNEIRTLADSFNPGQGMPTGTGDCCAPKLLNQAAINGWKPLSMAEFFWGKETVSGHRLEGEFYASCKDKCQPLLGFMLCGAETVAK